MVQDAPNVYLVQVQEPAEAFIADLLWIDVGIAAATTDDERREAARRYWS